MSNQNKLIITVLILMLLFIFFKSSKKDINISGSCTIQPAIVRISELYHHKYGKSFNIKAGNSYAGINDVNSGIVDIGMMSRELEKGKKQN